MCTVEVHLNGHDSFYCKGCHATLRWSLLVSFARSQNLFVFSEVDVTMSARLLKIADTETKEESKISAYMPYEALMELLPTLPGVDIVKALPEKGTSASVIALVILL